MWFFQAFTANASHRDRLLFPYFLALWIHQIMVICPTWYTRNEDGKTNCKCPGIRVLVLLGTTATVTAPRRPWPYVAPSTVA